MQGHNLWPACLSVCTCEAQRRPCMAAVRLLKRHACSLQQFAGSKRRILWRSTGSWQDCQWQQRVITSHLELHHTHDAIPSITRLVAKTAVYTIHGGCLQGGSFHIIACGFTHGLQRVQDCSGMHAWQRGLNKETCWDQSRGQNPCASHSVPAGYSHQCSAPCTLQ